MDREQLKKRAAVIAALAYMEEERNRKTQNTWVHSGRTMAVNNRQLVHIKNKR